MQNRMRDDLPAFVRFHGWEHTEVVLQAAETLLEHQPLSQEEKEDLKLAILFSDMGYVQSPNDPILGARNEAVTWLKEQGYPRSEEVGRIIMSRMPNAEANTTAEKVFHDAHLFPFAGSNYADQWLPRLQDEGRLLEDEPIKLRKWLKNHRKDLKKSTFLLEESKERWEKGLGDNVAIIQARRKEMKKQSGKDKSSSGSKKEDQFVSHISSNKSAQMIFKTSLRNHIDLTNIADNKANIMLSINAIIITITMPLLMSHVKSNGYHLVIPTAILLITCVTSIIFAALATRPIKMNGKTKSDSLTDRRNNLFFFGNFYNMDLLDYQDALNKVISDQRVLDQSIQNDLYYLGSALGIKFKLLRKCYLVFMLGIAISVVAFGIAMYKTM